MPDSGGSFGVDADVGAGVVVVDEGVKVEEGGAVASEDAGVLEEVAEVAEELSVAIEVQRLGSIFPGWATPISDCNSLSLASNSWGCSSYLCMARVVSLSLVAISSDVDFRIFGWACAGLA